MAGEYPSWRYGPNDAAVICDSADDVPAGFVDHPSKLKGSDLSADAKADPFDHDGDGKPGGSKPRRKKAVKHGNRR